MGDAEAAARFQRMLQSQMKNTSTTTGVNYKDPMICDAGGCSNKGGKLCARCKCRSYCSRDCQLAAWPDLHKSECKLLKICKQTPQVTQDMAQVRDDAAWTVAVTATKSHGTHLYVMEKFQFCGSESNREVVLASTQELTTKGVTDCIMDAILHPLFDCDEAGRRRPYYVEILKHTFPVASLVDDIATLTKRLGITIKSFSDEADVDTWCSHWFFVQQGWLDELHDDLFMTLIERDRRRPLAPNGMARKGVKVERKEAPRLDPNNFPTRQDTLKVKYTKTELQLYVVARNTTVYIMSERSGKVKVELRQEVQLRRRSGRPYPEDVSLCIYKTIVEKVKERPSELFIAQPSVCVLAEVEKYEKALDESICKSFISLAQQGNLEGMLDDFLKRGAR